MPMYLSSAKINHYVHLSLSAESVFFSHNNKSVIWLVSQSLTVGSSAKRVLNLYRQDFSCSWERAKMARLVVHVYRARREASLVGNGS